MDRRADYLRSIARRVAACVGRVTANLERVTGYAGVQCFSPPARELILSIITTKASKFSGSSQTDNRLELLQEGWEELKMLKSAPSQEVQQ